MSDYFILNSCPNISADIRLNNPTVNKLWSSFCLGGSQPEFSEGEENTLRLGSTAIPSLPAGKEYALCIDENGAAVRGCSYGGLVRGLFSLLMKIDPGEDTLKLPLCTEESRYNITNRMIHICVFPENDLYYIKKLIRLIGLCQYTHIVIEFWGMLQFDCLKELSWPNAFTKAEAAELIAEARELGMEPIPMFNQLGHATGCRLANGKHVVLDQNPRLQHLFTPDGWAWNIHSQKVEALLKQVRAELYELFGEGEYMHIGCDEAYYYSHCDGERAAMPDYLKRLTNQVAAEGKRPMIWMDMLLERNKFPGCYCTAKADEVDVLMASLNPSTVLVDWQYDVTAAPVPSLEHLKDSGHDVLGAPWYKQNNYRAHIDTVTKHNMFGIMMTTWHTLKEHMQSIIFCAQFCGAQTFTWSHNSTPFEETATLLRRVSFEGNNYEHSGWAKNQIDV